MSTDDQKPTVVELPKRDDAQAALAQFARMIPAMLEHVQLQAKVRRAAYLALVAEGFTEAQALDLCWRS